MLDIEVIIELLKGFFLNPIFHPFKAYCIDLQGFKITILGAASVVESVTTSTAPFFFIENFVKLEKYEKIKPFNLGRLNDCKGDLSKRWYISFYAWDELKQRKVKMRLYEINKFKTVIERLSFSKRYISELNEHLKKGLHLNPIKALEQEKLNKPITRLYKILEALNYAVLLVKATKRHETYLTYNSDVNAFKSFLEINKLDQIGIKHFKKDQVYLFIDYLLINRNVSNVTVNNKLACLKSLFSKLQERGIIEVNPFRNVKGLKKIITNKNSAYCKEQVQYLKETLLIKEPYLWFFIQFIYYTYIRPAELRRLKVGSIDFKNNKINISAEISKNKNQNILAIPKALMNELKRLKINTFDPEYYIFSAIKEPNRKKLSKNYMSSKHKEILTEKGFNANYTLYSWKHTGVVNAYKSGIDIKSIQLQCRHASIEQTDHYLKSLGFQDNIEILKIPEI